MTAKLFKAIRDGDVDELQQLIEKGASVNEPDKKGLTPLIECATQGFTEGISVLLNAGAKSSAKDKKDGRTALIAATIEGQEEIVIELIGKDQSINSVLNIQDSTGMSALHWALKLQEVEIAKLLLSQQETKVGTAANDGFTPLMYAVEIGNEEIVESLLKRSGAKATITSKDKNGNTALHLASLLGHETILESLLSNPSLSALVNSPNDNGETPLHFAASSDNVGVVKLLIDRGVELKSLTKEGLTPYQLCDPSTQSAVLIAEKTGEVPSAPEVISTPAEDAESEEVAEKKEKASSSEKTVRKRKMPPQVSGGRKGKQQEEAGSPLIARILLIIILGSSITYFLSMFF